MCKAVLKAMEHEWHQGKDSLERQVETYLLEADQGMNSNLTIDLARSPYLLKENNRMFLH